MSHTAPSVNKRKATVLHGQELKCKNGCGFYGNPEWQGYCSKCHRELNQKIKPERDSKGPSKKLGRSFSEAQDTLSLGFSKFEEKKKQQSEKRSKTIKSIIKRGHASKENATYSPSRDFCPVGEVFWIIRDLQLKDPVTKDVVKQIQRQLEIMSKHDDKAIDEQSEIMQDFYNFMSNRCETHPYYQDMTPEQIEEVMDKIEEQLMYFLHRSVFQQISSEYEEKDLALQKRIRSLNWITSQRLGLEIKENSPEVRDLIDKAITDVIEMDSKTAPQEKINSIVKCSKNIFSIINLCQGVASADEFLPAMVHIVLKANPPLLQSNIKYITSYSIPTRLRSGEGAYYFTNLCCAVSFIEHLTSESLNLSDEEFQRYMSGEVPQGSTEQNAMACEGLRLMSQNLATLTEIQEKNKQVLNDMQTLKDDMIKFQENIEKCKPISPLKINQTPYIVSADVDMSLIPEIFRGRVVREGPKEDILVDIDCKIQECLPTKTDNEANLPSNHSNANAHLNFNENEDLSDFHDVVLPIKPKTLAPNAANIETMQALQVALPLQSTNVDLFCDPLTSASSISQSSSNNFPHQQTINQSYVDIKDLQYPTELFPDVKSDEISFVDSQSAKPENCPAELNSGCVVDPLSPESGFMEENLHLPPPLLPVIVQKVNVEACDKKS